MASRKRVKRPLPERGEPIRNRMIPQPGTASPPNGNGAGSTLEAGLRAGRELAKVADSAARDAVESGVETAYMVCEEYIARGREAALRYRERSTGMDDKSGGRPWGDPWSQQAWGPMGPMIAPWMQMMRMWTDTMTAFAPAWGAMAAPWMPAGAGPWGPPPPVSILVSSKDPAEVSAELRPGAQRHALRVDALQPEDASGAPPLKGVTLESRGEGVRISVTVPRDQPGGRYQGTVIDQSGMVQGHLTVDVERKAPSRRSGTSKKKS